MLWKWEKISADHMSGKIDVSLFDSENYLLVLILAVSCSSGLLSTVCCAVGAVNDCLHRHIPQCFLQLNFLYQQATVLCTYKTFDLIL